MTVLQMKCRKCDSDLPEDSVYCTVCGGVVGDEQRNVVSYANLPFGSTFECPKCGAKNSRTDRWCGRCDADLDYAKKQRAVPGQKGIDCPECGASSVKGSNFCRICGTPFNQVPRGQSSGLYLTLGGDSESGITFEGSEPTHHHEIIRERQVIMIRCKYCGTLNGPSEKNCSSCGAQM